MFTIFSLMSFKCTVTRSSLTRTISCDTPHHITSCHVTPCQITSCHTMSHDTPSLTTLPTTCSLQDKDHQALAHLEPPVLMQALLEQPHCVAGPFLLHTYPVLSLSFLLLIRQLLEREQKCTHTCTHARTKD